MGSSNREDYIRQVEISLMCFSTPRVTRLKLKQPFISRRCCFSSSQVLRVCRAIHLRLLFRDFFWFLYPRSHVKVFRVDFPHGSLSWEAVYLIPGKEQTTYLEDFWNKNVSASKAASKQTDSRAVITPVTACTRALLETHFRCLVLFLYILLTSTTTTIRIRTTTPAAAPTMIRISLSFSTSWKSPFCSAGNTGLLIKLSYQ